jgi:hypothetical protein
MVSQVSDLRLLLHLRKHSHLLAQLVGFPAELGLDTDFSAVHVEQSVVGEWVRGEDWTKEKRTYTGSGAQAKARKATSVDAQLTPRLWYIWVVKSGNAVTPSVSLEPQCSPVGTYQHQTMIE